MKISVEEFKQLVVSHQAENKDLQERLDEAHQDNTQAWRRSNELEDANERHLDEIRRLRDLLFTSEQKAVETNRQMFDLRVGIGTSHLMETWLRQCIYNTASGQKIATIKIIRECLGLGLKESKDLFEQEYDAGREASNTFKPWGTHQESPKPLSTQLSLTNMRELLLAVGKEPNKIRAIKAVRDLTGASLKEAKDLVEAHFPNTHFYPEPINPPTIGDLVKAKLEQPRDDAGSSFGHANR